MGDSRDARSWVALELTRLGESKVDDGTLVGVLRRDLGVPESFPIFVPASTYLKGHKRITVHLMEGYVFVGSGLDDVVYYALEQQPYVAQVMSTTSGVHKMRTLCVLGVSHIESLQAQLRKMVVSDVNQGARVSVVDGAYKGLDGVVAGVEEDFAFVDITLRSLRVVATIPQIFLEVIIGDDLG